MGAESSSLLAIESLNSTLTNIEKKLGVIEDVHIHHERTICHDNVVIVSGKQIKCFPGVELTVGPVVGLVSQSSVRILVETNTDVELVFHFFLLDELHTDARYVFESTMEFKAAAPRAKTFEGFMPEKKYAVYIGGCQAKCTLLKYASFTTLPRAESLHKPNFMFSYSGRVDRVAPGEVNMLQEMQTRVLKTDRTQSPGKANPEPETEEKSGAVHMVVHLGDFINVDGLLRGRVIELLDMLARDEVNVEGWEIMLLELEEVVRDAYRRAFRAPEVELMLRRCGHIFLAGDGEAAAVTSSLLGMAPDAPSPPPAEPKDDTGDNDVTSPNSNKKGAVLGFREAKRRAQEEEDRRKAEEAEMARAPLKRGEEDPKAEPVETEEDLAVPSQGGATRRAKEAAREDVNLRSTASEELRRALLGAVVRLVRRVSWCYMRQLWDPEFAALEEEERKIETNQRNVIIKRKKLQTQTLLLSQLDTSLKKVVREFGEEYRASADVKERYNIVKKRVDRAQVDLRSCLDESAVLSTQVRDPPNGLCIDLGGLVVVLLESAWGWLGRDGLAHTLYNRDIAIHSEIINTLDTLLFEGRGRSTPSGDAVCTVLCASTTSLLPFAAEELSRPVDEPQSFKFAAGDQGKLLRCIASWQQKGPERATLIGVPCSAYAASGIIGPIIDEEDEDAKPGSASKDGQEGWDSERSRLRLILVNRMDRQTQARGISRYVSPDAKAPVNPLQVPPVGFYARYDAGSSVTRRSYWTIGLNAATKASQAEDGAYQTGEDASFRVVNCSDKREAVSVTVGPIIGRVSATSATVLLQVAHDAHVELQCVDQVTGVEYCNAQLLRKNVPTMFTFEELVPERSYDVRIAAPTETEARSRVSGEVDKASILVRGSFTTARKMASAAVEEEDAEANRVRRNLRAKALGIEPPPTPTSLFAQDGPSIAGSSSREGAVVPRTRKDAHKTVSLRAFVVGANRPSWLRTLPHQDPVEVDESGLGADRVHLARGLELQASLTDITSRSIAPVNLTIHCGYSVDLNSCMNTVVSLLARAEEAALIHANGYGASSAIDGSLVVEQVLADAYESLRTAYSLHWGGSSTSRLLAHGSHLVVSCPMLDILAAFNAPTLKQLGRDLSAFAIKELVRMATRLEAEYQTSLWDGGVMLPSMDGHARTKQRAHFLAGGSVAIVPLHLKTIYSQDSCGTSEDGLLPDAFFDSLGSLLGTEGHVGTPINSQEYEVNTLVLVSPLPLIHDDPALLEASFLSGAARRVSYSPSESLRLLDMLSAWCEEKVGREVIIVTGGVEVGHNTSIYCQLLDQEATGGEVEAALAQAEAAESAAMASQKEVERLKKIVAAHDEAKAGGEMTAQEEEKEKETETETEKETEKQRVVVPSFGGFGLKGMFGQEVPERKPSIQRKNSTGVGHGMHRAGSFRRSSSHSYARSRAESMISKASSGFDSASGTAMHIASELEGGAGVDEPLIVCIRQISVGALVGVPGDDWPEPEGQFFSAQRRFSYVHDYFENNPHCGFVEIRDNRGIHDYANPEGYRPAVTEVLDYATVAGVLKQEEEQELSRVEGTEIQVDLSVLKSEVVDELWKHTKAHLKGSRKAKADVPQNNDAISLSHSVHISLDAEETLEAYPRVHRAILLEGALSLPLTGGSALEDTLMAACRQLLALMPPHHRMICPCPSSLAIRLVWDKLVAAERKIQRKMPVKENDAETPDPRAMVVAAMTADAGYLAYIVRSCIETQALMEHFAYSFGTI